MSEAVEIQIDSPSGNVHANPCSIYRVPERLRSVNEQAYTPEAVYIGPYRHGTGGLIVTEEAKDNYLQNSNCGPFGTEEIVRSQLERLRMSYKHRIDQFSIGDFVTIILKDARFIIEVLLRYRFPELQDENYRTLIERHLSQLRLDMGLLENQVPFFILEILFYLERIPGLRPEERQGLSMMSLSYNFFKPLMHEGTIGNLEDIVPQHFVELLRSFYVSGHDVQAGAEKRMRTVPSVRELQQGGVKFEVLDSSNLFDIDFLADTKIMKIPKVLIGHETELTIRNVLAFEQCHCTLADNYMTDYVVFLDRLMSTQEDVKFLIKEKIVINKIVEEAAGTITPEGSAKDLIRNLTVGVIVDPNSFYFAELCQNVDKYCRSPKVVQKTMAVIGLLLSVAANIAQAIICQQKNC